MSLGLFYPSMDLGFILYAARRFPSQIMEMATEKRDYCSQEPSEINEARASALTATSIRILFLLLAKSCDFSTLRTDPHYDHHDLETRMSLVPVGKLCPSLNKPTPSTASSDSSPFGERRGRYYLYRDSENREPCLALGGQPASISSCADFLQYCIPITATKRSADCDKYKTTVLLLGDITPRINPKVTSSPCLSARCQAQSAIFIYDAAFHRP